MTNAPAWLAPDWRYAGDDWTGANALTYVVYATPPVYAADGVTIATPGVPQNLAGYAVTGTARYQCGRPGAAPPNLPAPITLTGAVKDPVNGIVTLSLAAAQTALPPQPFDRWGDPARALLIVQPRILDAAGEAVTVGLQPLFVF